MATEHEHRFTPFGQYFGRFGPQNVHYHPCIEVDDCDVVLVADTRGCEGPRTGTHRQEKLDGASDPSSEGRNPNAAVSGTGGSPNPEQRSEPYWALVCPHCKRQLRNSTSQCCHGEFGKTVYLRPDAEVRALATDLRESRAREEKLREALEKFAHETCREWIDETASYCHAPAEFLIWGKLTPPNGLGPRCYDHASEHVGHRALGDPSWAIVDLRPAHKALADGPSPSVPAEDSER